MSNTDEWFKDRLRKKWNLPDSVEIDLSGLHVEPAKKEEHNTVRVHFISGETRIVPAKDIHWHEEGARSATALVDGREVPIYSRPDWPDPYLWEEQMTYDEWLASQVEESE